MKTKISVTPGRLQPFAIWTRQTGGQWKIERFCATRTEAESVEKNFKK